MNATRAASSGVAIPSANDRILRYSLAERINHWIAGLSYVYCLITGLAFWSPYLFWLAVLVGGGPTARFWHPWFGLIFTAATFWMYRIWSRDMQTTDADRAWWTSLRFYVRNEDKNLPPCDRFNLGQKYFFWVMYYGAILLLLSGLVMWFVNLTPASLSWLRSLAVFVHVGAALLTIGGFIIHVYMGTAMVRGGFSSIIRGEVSPEWARLHHRLWYQRVTGQSSSRK